MQRAWRRVTRTSDQSIEGRDSRTRLVVSDGAIEKHIGNIFAKLGLEPRSEEHRRVRAVLAYLEQR
jgi:hypothetical protein